MSDSNGITPEPTPLVSVGKGQMPRGRPFQKGMSGNPSGRPHVPEEVKELARKHTPEAIMTLKKCLRARSEMVRVVAAQAILDRAWGKPQQELVGKDGGPIQLEAVQRDAERFRSEVLRLVARGETGEAPGVLPGDDAAGAGL